MGEFEGGEVIGEGVVGCVFEVCKMNIGVSMRGEGIEGGLGTGEGVDCYLLRRHCVRLCYVKLQIGRYGNSKIRAHLHLEICTLRLLYSAKVVPVFVSIRVSDSVL